MTDNSQINWTRSRWSTSKAFADRALANTLPWLGLPLVAALAFGLRLYGTNQGLPHLYYWDEPTVVNRAVRFGSGDLNPHFFFWPTLYMYVTFLVSGVYFAFGLLTGHFKSLQDFAIQYFVDPTGVYETARGFTALVGTACVLVTYQVGKRYFDPLTGFLGALFLTVSLVHVTNSHFAITDVPQSFFIISAYVPLYNIVKRGRWRDYVLCGLLIGLGTATKYLAGLLVMSLVLAHFFSMTNAEQGLSRQILLKKAFSPKLLAAGAAVLAGFFCGAPFVIIDASTFLAHYRNEMQQGNVDLQGIGATAYKLRFYLATVLPEDFGWPICLLALTGIGLMVWQRTRLFVLFLAFPLLYGLYVLRFPLMYARYVVQVDPFVAMAAAYGLATMARSARDRLKANATTIAYCVLGVVSAAVLVIPVTTTMRWDAMMARDTDTRTVALEWFQSTISPGTTVAIQSLFDRTYLNVPLTTDRSLQTARQEIPGGGRWDAVRAQVQSRLSRQPVYHEVEFVYDYEALHTAGVRYILISDQSWLDTARNNRATGSKEAQFRRDLETRATLVGRFSPPTDLQGEGSAAASLLPMIPPTISVYEVQ
jgi:hypothetical protein